MTGRMQGRPGETDAADPAATPSTEGDDTLVRMTELLGRKWHPVILHSLVTEGPLGFNELKDEVGDISSKVLSDSLDDLEEKGLVTRKVIDERPIRVTYAVTDRGLTLEPVLTTMERWADRHL